jgi:membrane-bound lytic murein transglycosylase D
VACHRPTAFPAVLFPVTLLVAVALSGCGTLTATSGTSISTMEPAAAAPVPAAPEYAEIVPPSAAPRRTPAAPSRPATAASYGTASPPLEEVREIRDSLHISRSIDLVTPPDDLWERIRNGFAMPNLGSPIVLDRQIWYASRPGDIKRMVDRSKRYLYHIVEALEKRGMPTELALLPMVESAFNPMAYSSAKASGLWQFIPSTGKSYNLQQNWWYDARRDIIASTNAALDYLQFLYDMHGDWHLALASYNWGENAVARAIEKNRKAGLPTDYLSLTMPQETRYYVPKLQALKNIIARPQAFNINLDHIPNERYFVTVPIKNIDIRLAAALAEMPVEELIALNPAHNRPVIAHSDTLVLPTDRAEVFRTNLESHDKPLVSWRAYTLQKGDKLDKLASNTGITLARLKQVNDITARTRVAPGLQILLPVKGSGAAAQPLPAMFSPPPVPERPKTATVQRTVVQKTTHTVVKGETLTSIANRYDVSVEDLRRWNQIGRLAAGQKLKIERNVVVSSPAPRAATTPRKASVVKKPAPGATKSQPASRVRAATKAPRTAT